MTRGLASAERGISHLEKEKARLQREVSTSKSLTSTIDKSKDEINKQLVTFKIENEKLNLTISKMELECENLSISLHNEAIKIEKLEEALAIERNRQIHQSEKSPKDSNFAKLHFDQQIQQIQAMHNTVLAQNTKELKQKHDDCKVLTSRIQFLTTEGETQKRELESFKKHLREILLQIEDLKAQIADNDLALGSIDHVKWKDQSLHQMEDIQRRLTTINVIK